MIELTCRACETGRSVAEASGVTGSQGRISVPNQASVGAGGQFGERFPDPSQSLGASEDIENLTQVVTAFIIVGRLQRCELPDAVCVAEKGFVTQPPGRDVPNAPPGD
jgi:hypothetical protein